MSPIAPIIAEGLDNNHLAGFNTIPKVLVAKLLIGLNILSLKKADIGLPSIISVQWFINDPTPLKTPLIANWICLAIGIIAPFKGPNTSFFTHSNKSLLTFLPKSIQGSIIPCFNAPAKPPWRLPVFLSLAPNNIVWKFSVEPNSPIPAPKAKLPSRPKGPKKAIPAAAAAAFGAAFLKKSLTFLFIKPSLSPKNACLNVSLALNAPKPAPIKAPPKGPKGVINPAIPPTIPKLFIEGKYWLKVLITSLLIIPPSLPFTSPVFSSLIALPNNASCIVSLLLTNPTALPNTAPTKGPPSIKPPTVPKAPWATTSGIPFLISV